MPGTIVLGSRRALLTVGALGLSVALGCSDSVGPGGTGGGDAAGAGGGVAGGGVAGGSAGGAAGASIPATQANGRFMTVNAPWYQDATAATVASDSSAITTWMLNHKAPNGWGTGQMKIDFSLLALEVPAGTATRTSATDQNFYSSPDCDLAPTPVPQGGVVEETYPMVPVFTGPFSGYDCFGFANGDDCHMLFVARFQSRLYELYHATISPSNVFTAGCLAIWDTTSAGDRGQQCTSADAAGFPIAPLLFTTEEVAQGHIDHAIRFILPNDMIRMRTYVSPATHGTNTTGPLTSIPYGGHLRLKSGYDVASLSAGARVIAAAMKKYGMFLSDGGNIALTAQSDRLSTIKWSDVGIDSNSLSALKSTDFEVIDHGATVDVTQRCQRTQLTQ